MMNTGERTEIDTLITELRGEIASLKERIARLEQEEELIYPVLVDADELARRLNAEPDGLPDGDEAFMDTINDYVVGSISYDELSGVDIMLLERATYTPDEHMYDCSPDPAYRDPDDDCDSYNGACERGE